MKTIRVSEITKKRLDILLSELIGFQRNPALTMDDALAKLLEEHYAKEKVKP